MPHLIAPPQQAVVRASASAAGPSAPRYVRHEPERTLLYVLVQAYCPDFLERLEREDRALPEYVRAAQQARSASVTLPRRTVGPVPKL